MTKSETNPVESGGLPDTKDPPAGKPQNLLTVQEVADYLRLGPDAVRDMAKKKILPARKVGRVWRFSPETLERWIEQGEHTESASEKS